jgi:hypothetical protein
VGTAHRIGFSFMVFGFSLKTENRIYHYLIIGGQGPPYIFIVAQASRLCRRRLKPAATFWWAMPTLHGGRGRPPHHRKQKTENSP